MQSLYFIGAGGIGMSALERYFLAEGKRVGGYDKTPSALTGQLIKEGVELHFEDNIDAVDAAFKDRQETLVVYTPAIPASHGELNWYRGQGFQVVKRSQLLGLITREKRGLCIAGTHGKTTTSSMVAHLLKQSHVDCAAFLGGILKPYDSNLMLSATSDLTVIEADEFDRSFHTLSPHIAVITSCDPDHLDIYGTESAYRESFAHFTSLIRPGGTLLMREGIRVEPRLQDGVRLLTYGVSDGVENPKQSGNAERTAPPAFQAVNLRIGGGTILFDLAIAPGALDAYPDGAVLHDMEPGVPVPINVENATAALAVALMCGATEDELRRALKTFGGARRRFDFYVKRPDLVVMDDYAHHPDEIKASLRSVKQLFAGRHVTVVFQPHLYSRTRDLADGFAEALSIPDRTLLLPIYPAREEPIPGVTSEWLLERIRSADKGVIGKPALLDHLALLRASGKLDVLVMMGAGDIERLVVPVCEALSHASTPTDSPS